MAAVLDLSKYRDRKVDVLAWHGGQPSGEDLLVAELANQSFPGEVTTGIQKLAQRFVIALLTESGTSPYKPELGTDFMRNIRRGTIRSTEQLISAFILAERTASRYLKAEETDDDPADERYGGASLTSATLSGDTVVLYVRLESLAESAEFIVPVPVVV